MERTVNRRTVVAGGALAALLAGRGLGRALAQDATPAGPDDFATLGFPALAVTITDAGYEGIPDSLPAGRYLLTATATTSSQGASDQQPPTVAFLSPTPAGMSAADFLQQFLPPAGEASPEAGGDQGGSEPLPLPVYQMKFAGGVLVVPGQTAQAVVDLTAGEWIAWADDPSGSTPPFVFTVTGEFPATVTEPPADITATLVDFAITLDGNLTAGHHIVKVQHEGAQPHFLEIDKGPDTLTKEMVQAALAGEMSGTPTANGLADSALQPVFYAPTQSIGTVTWHEVDLTAGTYLAACFFPTAGTGVPHAMNGMIEVVQVTG